MTNFTPFTYLIGWKSLNKFYYGVRYAKNCHPDDLWKTYFTSSKYVSEFRKYNGEPDIIQIRRTFLSQTDARLWESKVLRRTNSVKQERWLNKFDGIAISPDAALIGSKKSKNKQPWNIDDPRRNHLSKINIENKAYERLITPKAIEKSKESRKKYYNNLSLEERKQLTVFINSDSEIKKKRNESFKIYISSITKERRDELNEKIKLGRQNSSYSYSSDYERNQKIRESKLQHNPNFKEIVTCPHCGKSGQNAAMKRWHFSNCSTYRYDS